MRPMLTVMAARALGYQGQDHLKLAAIIEFIHTSTLLHDDVVDESDLRRGRETANALFGNAASVLVGDYLYSRSFQMMSELSNLRVMEILSDATNTIAEGEVLQLMNCNDPDTTEQSYMTVIYCKTAKLFEAATRLAAVLTHQPEPIEQAMTDYGKYLGTAFQIIDDVMDYCSQSDEMGKNVGDDLAEGKPTLPLLRAKGLDGFFAHVFGGDAFERKKPDPLPLLKTCEALGTDPARTLMVGDSSNDALAARAAGCPVVLVTYGYNHGQPVGAVDADGFVDSLAQLT